MKRATSSLAALLITNVAMAATMGFSTASAAESNYGESNYGSAHLSLKARTNPRSGGFESCVERLLDVGIELQNTVDACGAALDPKDLSRCVVSISNNTAIVGEEALAGCVRVRRPQEMARCVVSLDDNFDGLSSQIMGYCGRSLRPITFRNCVEGVSDAATAEPMLIMNSCAEVDYDAPQIFLPTFEPVGSGS